MARDDVKIPIDKHRLTKRWTWPRIKRGNRGSSSPIEDRNHKRPLVNYFFSFHPAIIKETVENGKKPGFGVNRRCIHLTYHCRFLTERPTFHPRLFFSLPIGQSVSIFNAVLPSEPCTRTPARSVKAQWNGRESCMRGRPLRTRHPSVRLISIRVGTLGGASQFLPVFARVTIDRWFNAPWPCFRDTISGEIKRSPLGREKTTGSVRWLNRDGRFVIPSLFFFFLSVKCSCVSRQSNSNCWKVSLGFWLLLSSFFTRMNDSTISVGILYRFLDERWTRFFADIGLSWGVSLSVKTCPSPSTRTISLSYPVHESWTTIREVNRENVTKDDSSFSIDSCKQFVTLWKITFIISSALLRFNIFNPNLFPSCIHFIKPIDH